MLFLTHPEEYTIGIDINNSKNPALRAGGKIFVCAKGGKDFVLIIFTFGKIKTKVMKEIVFASVRNVNGFRLLNVSFEDSETSVSLNEVVKAAFKGAKLEVKVALLSHINEDSIAIAFIGAKIEITKDEKGYNKVVSLELSEEGTKDLLNL